MDSVRTTFRAIVVAGLIVSLGITGVCAADAARGSLPRQACPTSQMCAGVQEISHSNCESVCHCGHQLPQKENHPVLNDSGQPLGLAANSASFSEIAAIAVQAQDRAVLLSCDDSSLIAQGTRLNC